MDALRIVLGNWQRLVIPLAVFAAAFGAGLIARRLVFRAIRRWAAGRSSRPVELLADQLRRPSIIWVLIVSIYTALGSSELPPGATALAGKALTVLWIVSFTFVAAGLASSLVRFYGQQATGALPVTSLTENIATLLVCVIGLLLLLNQFGVSIAPILGALGVGGLAVALALQDTLANLFAGFYVSMAGQLRVGDYIKLDSGEEGYVADIAWRSTTIRALANNLIIVPNSKLAQAIITNYHLPEKRMSLLIPVGVSYDCDPQRIERILVEEAKAGAEEIPGLLAEPEPFVRFIPGFGDSSLNFTLICQVAEFVDQYLAQHELRKRIFARFRREGIEIPFPIRTVQLAKRASAAGQGE
jgi:small-conductance mechanosensitive channel